MGRNKKTAGKTAEKSLRGSNVQEVRIDEARDYSEALAQMTPEVAAKIIATDLTGPADEPIDDEGFVPFEGEYEKRFYDVRLPDGTIVANCWPNAGLLNETEPAGHAGRSWTSGECEYRPAVEDPFERSNKEEEEARKIREEEEKLNRVRFGRLPNWKHKGWQFVFFFGRVPDPELPVSLVLGWKTFLLGVFKVKELPPEGQEITSENIRGTILQGQVWLPFDRFGKL